MAGIVDTNATSVLNGQSGALASQNRIANDFDTFLQLLTTQLQNQNPLEPLDTNEFTQQLVQFASVEQQISANTNLESLIGLQALNTQVSSLSYIDQEITYVGNNGYLKDGEMRFRVAAEKAPAEMTVFIQDQEGNVVKTYNPAPTGEPIDFVWDGTDNNGNTVEEGIYRIKVEAVDGEDNTISSFIGVTGRVSSVRSGPNNEILLAIEDLIIDSVNVIAIGQLTDGSPADTTPGDTSGGDDTGGGDAGGDSEGEGEAG